MVVSYQSSTDVGRTKLHTLDIQVSEGSLVFVKQYTIPLKYQNFIDDETKRLEEAGLISRSLSNWSAPCMVVPKKQDPDNPCEVQLRMVIDYRQLNKRIITSRAPDRNGKVGKVISNYPIPTIESLLARLEGCKYFSILDLRSGYHHIGLSKQSKSLTAFTMHSGKFQWNVLPFGIGIGVQTFSFVINKAISHCSDFAANYLDDIIVFSRTAEDHMEHLEKVFNALQAADLKIKVSKCKFFKKHVSYLGFLTGETGIRCDWSKIEASNKIATPTSIEEVCQFNGMCSYYRKFISHYSDISKCFNDTSPSAFNWWEENCCIFLKKISSPNAFYLFLPLFKQQTTPYSVLFFKKMKKYAFLFSFQTGTGSQWEGPHNNNKATCIQSKFIIHYI